MRTINLGRVLIASTLLFTLLMSHAMATEKKSNINVSATIVYNCEVIDIKTMKYCEKVELSQKENTITIKY